MIVIPKNYVLFSVNVSLGITGLMQVIRILMYQQTEEYKKSLESKVVPAPTQNSE